MLWHKAIGAGVKPQGPVEYIGSVTKSADDAQNWDAAEESLDILSIAETGDLVVIAFSFDGPADGTFSWNGMPFTPIYSQTSATTPGRYVGFRRVQADDENPFVSDVTAGTWADLSIVASVFRNAFSLSGNEIATSTTGMPNPPALTANGRLWVITGHLDDDVVTDWVAPANYTLADYEVNGSSNAASSTAIAYRIEDLTSDDPEAFTGSGDDTWAATTLAFN